jgi:hypothetical protein
VTDTDWLPLSRRTAGRPAEPLVEGVPEWLYPQLQRWLYQVLENDDGGVKVRRPGGGSAPNTEAIMLRLRIGGSPWSLKANDPLFLDALDAAVRWVDHDQWPGKMTKADPATLESMLAAANSVWRVNADWEGLERRVDTTVTTAVTSTIRGAGTEAAQHLAAAWTAAYGLHPDPDKAYAEAVKAAEAVACPLVLSTSPTATLGTVRNHLRDAAAKWELVLPGKDGAPGDVTPLVAMLTALWEGQRSRHAGTPSSRRQDRAEAEAAVHLAATLVQWLASGVLRRKP